jgi:hypothetical protein
MTKDSKSSSRKMRRDLIAVEAIAASRSGRAFLEKAAVDAWKLGAEWAWSALLAYSCLSLVIHILYSEQIVAQIMVPFHVVSFIWLWFSQKKYAMFSSARYFMWLLYTTIFVLTHFLTLFLIVKSGSPIPLEFGSICLAASIVVCMLIPGPVWYSVVLAAISVMACFFVGYEAKHGLGYFALTLMSCSAAVVWKAVVNESILETARSSLALHVTMAPAHVMTESCGLASSVGDFDIAERPTGILIIKWSELASQSHDLRPVELDDLLNVYFSMLDDVLREIVKHGAWYVDVIQHEIYVYIFEPIDGYNFEDSLLKLAVALMDARRNFPEFDVMGHLDIGVAFGSETSGIIGPNLYRKTAVVGRATASAIAAKTLGVPIRLQMGGQDRVLMSKEFVSGVMIDAEIYSIVIDYLFVSRGWTDESIFVIEASPRLSTPPVVGA